VDNWNNITNSQNRILFFKLSHNKVRYGRLSLVVNYYIVQLLYRNRDREDELGNF
jgi:hypothetical protein